MVIAAPLYTLPEADPGFVGPEANTILRPSQNQITNTKLDTKVKIYFGPLQGAWKGTAR